MKKKVNRFIKLASTISLLSVATSAFAGYQIKLTETDSITFGGYIKADARTVDGEVPYRDFWIGSGVSTPVSDSQEFRITARESRFNTKYVHGDVTGFIEMDFYGTPNGNEIISNSYTPRLRHAFIKYQDWLIGQTWSTFMNTSAIPETADFGGPLVGEAFIRQGQIRYTSAYGLSLAIENPETWASNGKKKDEFPDIVGKYTMKGDWGNVSFAVLVRRLDNEDYYTTTFGGSIAGRIKASGKSDFRFQYNQGNLGRYVGVTVARDIVNNANGEAEEEQSMAYSVAYRHFWNDSMRSNIFYGYGEADLAQTKRYHMGANVFQNLTKNLSVGIEFGQYTVADEALPEDASSYYGQLTAKYVL